MGSAYHSMRIWTHSSHYIDHHADLKILESHPSPKTPPKVHHHHHHRLPYHPMLNFLIFNKILDQLPSTSTSLLLPLRLVCSSWNAVISTRLNTEPTTPTSANIKYLKFDQVSHFIQLNKLMLSACPPPTFFLHNFYFKLPHFTPLLLSTLSTFGNTPSPIITRLKIAIYTSDFPLFLLNLNKLTTLQHLYIIRLPEPCMDAQNYISIYPSPSPFPHPPPLPHLVTIKLRNLSCSGKQSFLRENPSHLTTFLKYGPTSLQTLDFISWPGKIIVILEKSKIHRTLQVLRIKGKTLGDDDLKVLTGLGFPCLKRIEICLDRRNVMEEVWNNFYSSLGNDVVLMITRSNNTHEIIYKQNI